MRSLKWFDVNNIKLGECELDEFDCKNSEMYSTCINRSLICDQVNNCGNGYDELNCTQTCKRNYIA